MYDVYNREKQSNLVFKAEFCTFKLKESFDLNRYCNGNVYYGRVASKIKTWLQNLKAKHIILTHLLGLLWMTSCCWLLLTCYWLLLTCWQHALFAHCPLHGMWWPDFYVVLVKVIAIDFDCKYAFYLCHYITHILTEL